MTPRKATPKPKRPKTPGSGRKLAPIDPKVVEGMAGVGATNVEIADFLGLDESTVRARCGDVLTKARAGLKVRLRRAQMTAALGGNPAMLIWLGKQALGQKDKHELEHTGEGGGPLSVAVTHRVIDVADADD